MLLLAFFIFLIFAFINAPLFLALATIMYYYDFTAMFWIFLIIWLIQLYNTD